MSHRQYRVALALVTAVVMLTTLAWATITPSYRAPDEPQHANSIVRLMYGGGWPAPGEAHMAPINYTALEQGAVMSNLPGTTHPRFEHDFIEIMPTPDAERVEVSAENALPEQSFKGVDQMTQHPPAYYAVSAAVIDGLELDDERWDIQLAIMRMLSVLMVTPLPLLVAGTVRALAASRPLAAASATGPLFVPQLGHIDGSVSNDALLTLAGALATYLLVRVVRGDMRYRIAIALGAAIGVGLLTKAFMAFFVPAAGLAFLLARGRFPFMARLGRAALAGVVAAVIGGWWWVRNYALYGTLQPSANLTPHTDSARVSVLEYGQVAIGRLAQSFWGEFAWLEMPLPGVVVVAATAVLALLVVVGLWAGRRLPASWLLVGTVVLIVAAVLARGYANHLDTGLFPGLQGRYLFVAVAALLSVAFLGVGILLRGDRARTIALPFIVAAGLTAAAYGLLTAFRGFYVGPAGVEDAVHRWVAWSPIVTWQAVTVLLMLALCSLALLLWTGLLAARAREPIGAADEEKAEP